MRLGDSERNAMAEAGLKEARYWSKAETGRVQCALCPHGCRIAEGQTGLCRVRQNLQGTLRTLNYARVSAANFDPVEKKPLFHFCPGSVILSLGSVGCNLACSFCQNWAISQQDAGTRRMTPEEAVALAGRDATSIGIAYTYNEPFVWYEYVLETAGLARAGGLRNVLVTNGYVSEEPLREMLPFIDAMNVDIKSTSDRFYRELCRGRAEPPRRTVEIAKEAGCLVEVTNLVIPNWNDSEEALGGFIDWVTSVDPEMPVHFSRYHPDYKLTEPPTPADTLMRARDMARAKLRYVYVGNLWGGEGEDTVCGSCGKTVVERRGFAVSEIRVVGGHCEFCGGHVPIVGT
jgi:pyruvate formate lyase activating enzyme